MGDSDSVQEPAYIETFKSYCGNHHLIDPTLNAGDTDSPAYKELCTYLRLTTSFIDTLANGEQLEATAYDLQYQRLLGMSPDDADNHMKQTKAVRKLVSKLPSLKLNTKKYDNYTADNGRYVGPSQAMLHLHNGRQSEDMRSDVGSFLSGIFKPHDWTNKAFAMKKLYGAGHEILGDHEFMEQVYQMVDTENEVLSHNPDHMPLYHAAENNVLQLYTFINVWRSVLTGETVDELPTITTFRFAEYMADSFSSVSTFLTKMTKQFAEKDEVFNNVPGFADLALSCNPTLFSNTHTTASCSLWWYYNSKDNDRAPVKDVVAELMGALGLNESSRQARYVQLFERASFNHETGKHQSLMQQMFVPYDEANERAYVCQVWGRRFSKNPIELEKPETLRELRAEPFQFEQQLRANKSAFTNFRPGEYMTFGDTERGFKYADLLQVRYMPNHSKRVIHRSYVRDPAQQRAFVSELMQLVGEDYADYLVTGSKIPRAIVAGANKVTKQHRARLRLFNRNTSPPEDAMFHMQMRLKRGLVENADPRVYGKIQALDYHAKGRIQNRIRESDVLEKFNPRKSVYMLCNYVKGYTYLDLLKEAVEETITHDESKEFVLRMIDTYQTYEVAIRAKWSASIDNPLYLSGNDYQRLGTLMAQRVESYRFSEEKHEIMHPEDNRYVETMVFATDLSFATECIMNYARIAKAVGYNEDMTKTVMQQL